jgi:hypothetical protein
LIIYKKKSKFPVITLTRVVGRGRVQPNLGVGVDAYMLTLWFGMDASRPNLEVGVAVCPNPKLGVDAFTPTPKVGADAPTWGLGADASRPTLGVGVDESMPFGRGRVNAHLGVG